MSRAWLFAIGALAACSSKTEPPRPAPVPALVDAGIDSVIAPGVHDPNVAHEDPTAPAPTRPPPKRAGRPIEILLRSSPPGATVSVDGFAIGVTPTYWAGETGAEHEFTFSLPRHALARYRFLPITTGTLHARLDPVATDVDAGVPPPGLVQQPPIAPPATQVTPAKPSVDAGIEEPVVLDAGVEQAPPIGPTP